MMEGGHSVSFQLMGALGPSQTPEKPGNTHTIPKKPWNLAHSRGIGGLLIPTRGFPESAGGLKVEFRHWVHVHIAIPYGSGIVLLLPSQS